MHRLSSFLLLFSLFFPRIALFLEWLSHFPFPVAQPSSAVLFVFLPRVLVLVMIFVDRGVGFWFWLHLGAALIVWATGVHQATRPTN